MTTKDEQATKPSQNQIVYANMLVVGVWVSIFIMMVTYFIYLANILPAHADISIITQNWDKGVNEFLHATNSPHGWGWVGLLAKGDFLNYIGFAFLALMTIICYIVLLKGFISQKDWTYAVIAFLEIAVLSVAASGLLGSGGH
ncbi:MAG: DUF1634 domain-containing protein [Desulfobacteraceae bacterium]|nr:DUF1634 domain-containing protein [Desulfobacteraceae bacterium]